MESLKDLYLGTEVRGSIMYDIYISNLADSSRNIVCTKGLLVENPNKARWQAHNNTRERERERERERRLQDHSNASVQDLGWPSC